MPGNSSSLSKKSASLGSTIIVIEHHGELIQQADWLIDLGDGPGKKGGQLLFEGDLICF